VAHRLNGAGQGEANPSYRFENLRLSYCRQRLRAVTRRSSTALSAIPARR
jgi:hypothetical protein